MCIRFLFLSFIAILFFNSTAIAQGVTIGSLNSPHNSAVLDLQSTNKGFLPPRLTTAQRKAIGSPAAGLVVFDTDNAQLYLFDGTQWLPLNASGASNSVTPAQLSSPPKDIKQSAYFGTDVALSETYAVVGSPRSDSGTRLGAGAIFIYKKSSTGGWSQVAKKFAGDPLADANFGMGVAISGNYIVVGAPGFKIDALYNVGKIYVFVKGSGDTWTQQTSFTRASPAAGEFFGYNVAVSSVTTGGPVIIATAPYRGTGIAEVYQYTNKTWNYLQTLKPTDLRVDDRFGMDVDIDKDYCVVSAPYQDYALYNYADAGAAYIFVYGGGTWLQQFKLLGNTAKAAFGFSVSIRGNQLAVTAPFASPYSNTTATVYTYERQTTEWINQSYLYLFDQQGFDATNWLGVSVSLDNSYLMVSMPAGVLYHTASSSYYSFKPGLVLVYKKNPGSSNHTLVKAINDNEALPGTQNIFGNSVSMKNGNYIIGIPYKTVNGVLAAGAVAFGYIE